MSTTDQFGISECVMVDAIAVSPRNYIFLAHQESSLDGKSPVCGLIAYLDGQWTPLAAWDWEAVALARVPGGPNAGILVLGRDGQVGSWSAMGLDELQLDPPRPVGPFRGMRRFADSVIAYGMKREVFVRESDGTWTRSMRGIDPPDEDDDDWPKLKLGGFNGIAQGPDGTLTAVGMRGEIWLFSKGSWRQVDSPTNIMLKDLVAGGDGRLYACGLEGTLLAGQGEAWTVIDYVGPKLDFVAACWFNDRLFLADGHSLRVLNGSELELVDHGASEIVPCAAIECSSDSILSIAGQEVWESSNGTSWTMLLG